MVTGASSRVVRAHFEGGSRWVRASGQIPVMPHIMRPHRDYIDDFERFAGKVYIGNIIKKPEA